MTQNEKERNVDIFRSHQFAPFFLTIRYQNKKFAIGSLSIQPVLGSMGLSGTEQVKVAAALARI